MQLCVWCDEHKNQLNIKSIQITATALRILSSSDQLAHRCLVGYNMEAICSTVADALPTADFPDFTTRPPRLELAGDIDGIEPHEK
jgi:hypothetical protein